MLLIFSYNILLHFATCCSHTLFHLISLMLSVVVLFYFNLHNLYTFSDNIFVLSGLFLMTILARISCFLLHLFILL